MRKMIVARSVIAAVFSLAVLAGNRPAAANMGAASATATKPTVETRPNILFILADDMGYGDLSLTGNTQVSTPNIDRLAREGLVMTQFYDPAPICSASRAGFITGQFPARNRFVTYIDTRKRNGMMGQANWLDPSVQTLPRALKGAGYATGHFGKWHLGGGRDVGDAPLPTAYGFDESYTQFEGLGPRGLPNDLPGSLAKQSADLGKGPIDWLERAQVTSRYVDKTLAFAARNKGRPWFAQMWLDDVHTPWLPDSEQETAIGNAGDTAREKKFLSVLAAMDRQVGRLIDTLRATGQLDNTLIVFTSDNGPTVGANTPGSAGPYRGRKGSLYEGGIRQPLIVRWPGRVPAGVRDATTVGQGVDLYPTLAAIGGATPPAAPDGISLVSAWRGKPIAEHPALYGYIARPARAGDAAGPPVSIRSDRWKLLANLDGSAAELYDVVGDPRESHDVLSAQPVVAKGLTEKLVTWVKAMRLQPPIDPNAQRAQPGPVE